MTSTAIWLLITLFLVHFLGDFTPLSTPRMQEAKATGKPVGPILLHGLVHAILVGLAVVAVVRPGGSVVTAAVGIEFVTHFGIDWGRGLLAGRSSTLSDPKNQSFWTILGSDQLAHGLVLIWIAALVL